MLKLQALASFSMYHTRILILKGRDADREKEISAELSYTVTSSLDAYSVSGGLKKTKSSVDWLDYKLFEAIMANISLEEEVNNMSDDILDLPSQFRMSVMTADPGVHSRIYTNFMTRSSKMVGQVNSAMWSFVRGRDQGLRAVHRVRQIPGWHPEVPQLLPNPTSLASTTGFPCRSCSN